MEKSEFWNRSDHFTRIKLCEFESLDESSKACSIGAHALGFHIFRHQEVKGKVNRFEAIFRCLPDTVQRVLLTDVRLEVLTDEILPALDIDIVQLYPDWNQEDVQKLRRSFSKLRLLKVMSARSEENAISDPQLFLSYYDKVVDGYLLDSFRVGGTGKTADWQHCRRVVQMTDLPVFLAGGLHAGNIAEAIRTVRPFGVDVETGVSDRIPNGPLVKNMEKCRQFVAAVLCADREIQKEGC